MNYRNGFTYAANITVLTFALILFNVLDDNKEQFRILCLIALSIGSCSSLFYMFTIAEVRLTKEAAHYDAIYKRAQLGGNAPTTDGQKKKAKDVGEWLSDWNFYIHGIVYMVVRIAVNTTMTVQPFYLNLVTGYEVTEAQPTPVQLAIVPLLSYISSLIFSVFFQAKMTRCLRNRFLPMLISILIIIVSSAPLAFLNDDETWRNLVYPLSALQGIGMAIMLNTATSLISDVIGNDAENSAFVYGCYSLFDKFANGGLLFWIIDSYSDNGDALKYIMAFVPILCSILAYVLTFIGNKYFSHKLAKITGIK